MNEPDAGAHADVPPSLRTRRLRLAVAALVLSLDLWTKHVVFYPHVLHPAFDPDRGALVVGEVASWWRTILVYNQGVTFGLLDWVPMWAKALFTLAVIAWLAARLWKSPQGRVAEPLALAMIVGGAVGNLYDRALRPHVEPDKHPGVRDFLDWHAPPGTWLAERLREHNITTHWYTSNVADVCIVAGVILLAIVMFREGATDAPGNGRAPGAGEPASA